MGCNKIYCVLRKIEFRKKKFCVNIFFKIFYAIILDNKSDFAIKRENSCYANLRVLTIFLEW